MIIQWLDKMDEHVFIIYNIYIYNINATEWFLNKMEGPVTGIPSIIIYLLFEG